MCPWSSCSVRVKVITPLAIIIDILNQKSDEVHNNCFDINEIYDGNAAAADGDDTKDTLLLIDVYTVCITCDKNLQNE
jgi:hypothetical protein